MIIQCDNCMTKFRLDDSRIKSGGVRVRCTKCQNVFVITPPPTADDVRGEEHLGISAESGQPPEGLGEPSAGEGAGDYGIADREVPSGSGLPRYEDGGGSGEERETPTSGAFDNIDFSFGIDRSEAASEAPADTPEDERGGGAAEEAVEGKDFGSYEGSDDNEDLAAYWKDSFEESVVNEEENPGESTYDGGLAGSGEQSAETGADRDFTVESVGAEGKPFEDFDLNFTRPSGDKEEGEAGTGIEEEFDVGTGETDPGQGLGDESNYDYEEDSGKGFDLGLEGEDEYGIEVSIEGAEGFEEPGEPAASAADFKDKSFDDETGEEAGGDDYGYKGFEAVYPGGDGEEGGLAGEGYTDKHLEGPAERSASDEFAGTSETPSVLDKKVIPFSPGVKKGEGSAAEKAPDFSEVFSRVISRDDRLPPGEESEDEDEFEFEDTVAASSSARVNAQRKPSSLRLGLLVAGLIIIFGGGGLYASGLIDIVARQFLPGAQQTEPQVVGIERLKGRLVENSSLGNLFAIEAVVRNMTDEPQELKTVRGVLYDKSGRKIIERTVSPGRILSSADLENLSGKEIEKYFNDTSGGTIPPKGIIPVMVVFTEIPSGVGEFGLDIVR